MSGVGEITNVSADHPSHPVLHLLTFPCGGFFWQSVVCIPAIGDIWVVQGTQSCGKCSLYERAGGQGEAQQRGRTQSSMLITLSVAARLCPAYLEGCGEVWVTANLGIKDVEKNWGCWV